MNRVALSATSKANARRARAPKRTARRDPRRCEPAQRAWQARPYRSEPPKVEIPTAGHAGRRATAGGRARVLTPARGRARDDQMRLLCSPDAARLAREAVLDDAARPVRREFREPP